MSYKWKKKLTALKITETDLSVSIKKMVSEINALVSARDQLATELEDDELDDHARQSLENQQTEIDETIGEMDDAILAKIEAWFPKREEYAAKMAKMKAAREKKARDAKAAKQPTAAPQAAPTPAPEPAPVKTPVPDPAPAKVDPPAAPKGSDDPNQQPAGDDEGKKSNVGLWVIGGIAAAIGLGALANALLKRN